jgi:DNA helicase-2/ATP-dependent DNA helicase PcrA
MDKKVIFAVAGSGKTTHVIDNLDHERRFLLLTYTDNNFRNLQRKIVERFGFVPPNISIYKYFSFLHSFCCKPFLAMEMRSRGINFETPPQRTLRLPRTADEFYLDSGRRIYHNRIAKLLDSKAVMDDVRRRIEKYYDVLCLDEVQDIGGYDFDFLMALCTCRVSILFVGDFFQHTYTTSQDGRKNANLFENYRTYTNRLSAAGLTVDSTALAASYRCSASVCDFIRSRIGVVIESRCDRTTQVMELDCQSDADRLFEDPDTVKLFYKEHHKFGCLSENWGGSKGIDHYQDVCVILNGTAYKALKARNPQALVPETRNKLYVACSRARGHLYLISDRHFRKFKQPDR